ncbi:hypothetical protein, partial [Corynebacterium sanguinis]
LQIACRTASSAARPQRASRGLATFNWVTTVDVVLPNTTNAKSRGGKNYRFRSGRLAPEHVEIVDNVSVTSRIACLFDICRYHGRLACLVALESARNTWPELTVVTLLEMSRGLPRAKGLRLFRQVIEASVGTSESALETVVRDLVVRIPGVT